MQRRSSHQGSAQRSIIDPRIQWREQGACATKNILSAESARMLPQIWARRPQCPEKFPSGASTQICHTGILRDHRLMRNSRQRLNKNWRHRACDILVESKAGRTSQVWRKKKQTLRLSRSLLLMLGGDYRFHSTSPLVGESPQYDCRGQGCAGQEARCESDNCNLQSGHWSPRPSQAVCYCRCGQGNTE